MRDLTYPPVVVAVKALFRALDVQVAVEGVEHLPRTGGAVLALNHVSYVDFLLAGYAADRADRRVRFLAKRELFDDRRTRWLMRSLHHIEVDRAAGAESYAAGVRALRSGELVGVFPEATISRSFELKDFKTGAARMAAEAAVPIVPAVLWGGQRIKTKDHPHDLHRGHRVVIVVGEPVDLGAADPRVSTAELRASMQRLLDRAVERYPDTGAGAWWQAAARGGRAPTPAEADRMDAEERRRRSA